MIESIRTLLDTKEQKRFLQLILLMLVVALLEFFGIALVLPFIRFAGSQLSPEEVPTWLYSILSENPHYLISLGFLVFALIALSAMMRAYLAWREQKFVWDLSHRLSLKQHRNILSKPYVYFLEKNSSEIITTLIVETSTTVRGVLLPFAQIISNLLVAFLFIGLITYLHPKISLILFTSGLLIGGVIIVFLKNKLSALGAKRLKLEQSRYLQLKESIIGIKTVKSNAKESFFLDKFKEISRVYSDIKPLVNTLNAIPKFVMDILLFGGIVLLVTFILIQKGDVGILLPKLTFYVLVGFKLFPTFQSIINAIITIRFSYPSIKAVFAGLENSDTTILRKSSERLAFKKQITVDELTFSHVENEDVIKSVSLTIEKGQKIGIVGYSGSGKTTLVELILGLLKPNSGKIKYDDVTLSDEILPELMNTVAFIPQNVFFFDDTMLRNITFEENPDRVDFGRLESLFKMLALNNFIDELPHGLATKVGELGVKMSGGQKQRIGFARAMYRNPEILILDESTSAMDYVTEQELLNNLKTHRPDLTFIKIAHRLKSVKDCDIIYFMDKGKIIAQGNFEEIINKSSLFKEMVFAGTI